MKTQYFCETIFYDKVVVSHDFVGGIFGTKKHAC